MSLSFVIKEGFSSIGRAKLPAAITVTISFFALVLLGLFSTVSLSFFDVIQELRSKVELEVFLGDSMSESQAIDATGQIKMLKGVKEAFYVSKDDAAKTFNRDFGEDIVKILGSNPLPGSIRLKFLPDYATPVCIGRIVPEIRKIAPDSDIRYNQSYLGQIEKNARLFTLLTGRHRGIDFPGNDCADRLHDSACDVFKEGKNQDNASCRCYRLVYRRTLCYRRSASGAAFRSVGCRGGLSAF